MKCPNCEYVDCEYVDGKYNYSKEGRFFELPIEMKRNQYEERVLFGCPKCGRTFIVVD